MYGRNAASLPAGERIGWLLAASGLCMLNGCRQPLLLPFNQFAGQHWNVVVSVSRCTARMLQAHHTMCHAHKLLTSLISIQPYHALLSRAHLNSPHALHSSNCCSYSHLNLQVHWYPALPIGRQCRFSDCTADGCLLVLTRRLG